LEPFALVSITNEILSYCKQTVHQQQWQDTAAKINIDVMCLVAAEA